MKGVLRGADAAAATATAARVTSLGLIQVLIGPDPVPASWSRSQRWTAKALAALGMALLAVGVLDAALAVSVSPHVAGPPNPFDHGHPIFLAQYLPLFAAGVAPLLLAARYPLVSWRIGYLTTLLGPLVPGRSVWVPPQIAVLLVVFCVAGPRRGRPVLWSMWALMLLPIWLWTGPDWVKPVEVTLGLTAITAVLDGARAWRRARRALAAQSERAELEHARRAMLEERARIAREMHDVVAHHMSLIAVQAETAPYRLSDLPQPVRAEFAALSQAAREALTDMRKLLGVLRDDVPPERSPQPQFVELPELVAAARRAGVDVELSMPAPGAPVPPGVGVCAYRIVQEALSNAGRHAAGAAVKVTVDWNGDVVRLRVTNGPGTPASPSPNGHGPGHGLAGMRERVALLDGSMTAGPTQDGGFAVSAVLPLRTTA